MEHNWNEGCRWKCRVLCSNPCLLTELQFWDCTESSFSLGQTSGFPAISFICLWLCRLKETWVCCQADSALSAAGEGLLGWWAVQGVGMLQHCLVAVRVGGCVTSVIHRHFTSYILTLVARFQCFCVQNKGWRCPPAGSSHSYQLISLAATTTSVKPSPVVCSPITADSIATMTLKSCSQVPPCLLAEGNQISLPSARLPAFSFLRKEPGRGWSFSLCSSDSIFSCSPTDCFAPLPYHPIPP